MAHTGLFERSDLVELIEQQQHQTDSRLSDEELDIARRALNFNEYKVHDVWYRAKPSRRYWQMTTSARF